MGFGKVAPAPLRLVCAKAALTSRVRHRNTFRERITWFPPEDWRYDFHPCFYPEFITVWLHRSEFHVKTEGWIGSLRGFLPTFKLFNEHLLDRLIVGAQDVPDAVSAHQVANLFGKVLGMVSRSFQRLRQTAHGSSPGAASPRGSPGGAGRSGCADDRAPHPSARPPKPCRGP